MSRISHFEGTMDLPEPGEDSATAVVIGTQNAPALGFVRVPLAAFSYRDQVRLRTEYDDEARGVKIEGRSCPRRTRCWVVD